MTRLPSELTSLAFEFQKLTETRVEMQSLASLSNRFLKITASSVLPEEIKGNIEKASKSNLGIPNFQQILGEYNQSSGSPIGTLRLSLQKNSWGKIESISTYLIPTDGTAAVLTPQLTQMVSDTQRGVAQYLKQYDMAEGLESGIYTADFHIGS